MLKVTIKQRCVSEDVPQLVYHRVLRHYNNLLQESLRLVRISYLIAKVIKLEVGQFLICIIPHHFLCHFSLIICESEEIVLGSHISNVVSQFSPVFTSSDFLLSLRQLTLLRLIAIILAFFIGLFGLLTSKYIFDLAHEIFKS